MKKIFLFILMNCAFCSFSQGVDSTGYYTQMNNIFSSLDKTQIASGLLKDYAVEFNNWDNFVGTSIHDSNMVSLEEWRLLYNGLYTAQIRNPTMLYMDTINRLLSKYANSQDPVNMAVLYYKG